MDLSRLASTLGDVSDSDLEKELASLKEKGLVFQEGEHFLSLVFPRKGSHYKKFKEDIA